MKEFIFHWNNNEYYIYVGINANSNWKLLDNALPYDILFHVDKYSSSYIILNNKDIQLLKDIPRQVIKRCACLCKSHSSSKSLKNINIKYTFIKNCNKGTVEGEVYMNNTKYIII